MTLSAEASEDLASEEGSTVAQEVKEKVVEAAKQVLDLSKDLEHSTIGQASEVLKTHMKVKMELDSLEVVALVADASSNIASSTLSEPIDLDSPPHSSPHLDDQPFSLVFSNLQKLRNPHLN